jgi:cellulose synthase/poly-beta-1,6-N-acetylglucosamine synthase-like glycosyltransferase
MRYFSTLAGPWQPLPKGNRYEVAFTELKTNDRFVYRMWTRIISFVTIALVIIFALILFQPAHWLVVQNPDTPQRFESLVMLFCLALLQLFVIISTYSSTRSTLKARNPIPVRPPKGLRVVFVTTRAPGEPIDMVARTLEAIKRVKYAKGTVDAWLLDETNDPELKELCKRLGVHHFSRKSKTSWNTGKVEKKRLLRAWHYARWVMTFGLVKLPKQKKLPNPFYAARSKHGNFNSWRAYLQRSKLSYDILCGVDTDHIPEPNYLDRMLGYFRDPNVAYVVGPQVYGNYRNGFRGLVARWAESQASFFQSTIQRAGNASHSPMFVGTNYAVRMSVLNQIYGFQPCITEDMATGLAIHSEHNPVTGHRWKSVYTPDVLAVGEGPDFWGPYFTQQWRWAAGTFDTWRRKVWRVFFRLTPRAMLHYFLMLTFYPIKALEWLLGIVSSMTYLITGATAIIAPWNQFVSLYLMATLMQVSLYVWNRRYNVSPHEPEGTYGVPGMALTALTSPIYLSALIGIAIGRKPHFVVTKKGSDENPDSLQAFKTHLRWAALISAGLIYGILNGHTHPSMIVWAMVQLVICLIPVGLGMSQVLAGRMHREPRSRLITAGESNA